jgi:hypothetical protein
VDPLPQHRTPGDLLRDLPKTIGAYVVEQRIVAGPSYAEYQARHVTLGHQVVLRQERWPSQPGAPLGAIEGLRRSRRLQAELRHPHILPMLYKSTSVDGTFHRNLVSFLEGLVAGLVRDPVSALKT